jgi:hypothetical protein
LHLEEKSRKVLLLVTYLPSCCLDGVSTQPVKNWPRETLQTLDPYNPQDFAMIEFVATEV